MRKITLPYDPDRPDLTKIVDEFNNPLAMALYRAGQLPGCTTKPPEPPHKYQSAPGRAD